MPVSKSSTDKPTPLGSCAVFGACVCLFLIVAGCGASARSVELPVQLSERREVAVDGARFIVQATDFPAARAILVETTHKEHRRPAILGAKSRCFVSLVQVDGDGVRLYDTVETPTRLRIPPVAVFLLDAEQVITQNRDAKYLVDNLSPLWEGVIGGLGIWQSLYENSPERRHRILVRELRPTESNAQLAPFERFIVVDELKQRAGYKTKGYDRDIVLLEVLMVGDELAVALRHSERIDIFTFSADESQPPRLHHTIDLAAHGKRGLVLKALSHDGDTVLLHDWGFRTNYHAYDVETRKLTALGTGSGKGFEIVHYLDSTRQAAVEVALESIEAVLQSGRSTE